MNLVDYTIVAQVMESKGIVSVSYFLRFIQILGSLEILAHQNTVNKQNTNTGLLNISCHVSNSGKLRYACRQEIQ
jgi:hypothetical protein